MAVAEEQRTNEGQGGDEGGHTGAALKAAGAAAATGAAAYAVQRALSNRSKNGSDDDEGGARREKGKSGTGSLLASAASGGWDAARDTVMPLAEDAAGAAGKYLAEHAPDFVSDHIVPKFIEGFNEGRR